MRKLHLIAIILVLLLLTGCPIKKNNLTNESTITGKVEMGWFDPNAADCSLTMLDSAMTSVGNPIPFVLDVDNNFRIILRSTEYLRLDCTVSYKRTRTARGHAFTGNLTAIGDIKQGTVINVNIGTTLESGTMEEELKKGGEFVETEEKVRSAIFKLGRAATAPQPSYVLTREDPSIRALEDWWFDYMVLNQSSATQQDKSATQRVIDLLNQSSMPQQPTATKQTATKQPTTPMPTAVVPAAPIGSLSHDLIPLPMSTVVVPPAPIGAFLIAPNIPQEATVVVPPAPIGSIAKLKINNAPVSTNGMTLQKSIPINVPLSVVPDFVKATQHVLLQGKAGTAAIPLRMIASGVLSSDPLKSLPLAMQLPSEQPGFVSADIRRLMASSGATTFTICAVDLKISNCNGLTTPNIQTFQLTTKDGTAPSLASLENNNLTIGGNQLGTGAIVVHLSGKIPLTIEKQAVQDPAVNAGYDALIVQGKQGQKVLPIRLSSTGSIYENVDITSLLNPTGTTALTICIVSIADEVLAKADQLDRICSFALFAAPPVTVEVP